MHCAHTIKSRKLSPRAPYPLVYCIELTQKNVWQKFSPVLHSLRTHTIACHLFGNSMQSWLGNRFLNFNLCSESKIYQTVIIEKRRVILCKKTSIRTTSPFIKKYTSLGGVYCAYFCLVCVCVLVSIYSEAIFRVWLKIWWVINWNRSVWTWCSSHSSNTTVNRFSPFVYLQMNVVSYCHALRTHTSVIHWTSTDVFCCCVLCLLHHILTCLSFALFVHQ